jgi:hypothetical protein
MAGLAQTLNRYAYGVNNPVRWTDHSGNMPDGMSASDATRIGGGESSAGDFQADSQLVDDSYARGMAQQNAGRSYEENASEVPFTQVMREQTQARAMQAQRDVIAGFQTLGTGNKYVGNWTKFMYAAGKGARKVCKILKNCGQSKDESEIHQSVYRLRLQENLWRGSE